MKIENMMNQPTSNETARNFLKKNKLLILALTVIVIAALTYIMAYHEEADVKPMAITTTSACVLTTGCTSNSCINNKQYQYNSSGVRQCCKC
jgi:hypothetical protein